MSGSRQRYRSPKNVTDEILEIVKFHDHKPLSLEITDPHFMGKPKIVEQICDILAPLELDIKFSAKVRPDMMAKYPDIVRKMISVGIESFEMGIESPNPRDIKSTSKGLKTDVHIKAVNNIKRWGGNAGGTFLIGLPDQTEEEILQFPAYAKKIGLMSSAYGIATPYPTTEFYEDLYSKELIFEDDWNRFDEMHSVFNARYIPSERIEELASICMAKFWTLDLFIERERVHMIKTGTKMPLAEFISDRVHDIRFSVGSGSQLQDDNFSAHVMEFLEASPDPDIKRYTQEIGMHNVIEMSGFLNLLGVQTIQLTMRDNGKALTSWIIKTTKDTVEYINVIQGKIDESTINFEIDLNDFQLDGKRKSSKFNDVLTIFKLLSSNRGLKRQFNLIRLLLAGSVELVKYTGRKNISTLKNIK